MRTAVCVTPFVPEIVAVLVIDTVWVVTVNVAVVLPAVTVTLAGTVATAVRLLESVIVAPPVGAGPDSITVPVDDCIPPLTVVGFSVSALSVGAVTVKTAV
jgi:hypothetical protein